MACFDWADWPADELLDVRLCDLRVHIDGTWLEAMAGQIHRELGRRDLLLKPHFWLSDEWFSPDGVPGVALPFYLAHPRLMRLERKQMLAVEGGSRTDCLKLMRHEVGHAIQHGFQLHRRRKWSLQSHLLLSQDLGESVLQAPLGRKSKHSPAHRSSLCRHKWRQIHAYRWYPS